MFDEVKEMIDSTIYENGRGEVTAQNVNLAMHGVVDATEEELGKVNDAVKTVKDKVTAIEENGTGGGSGALRWWLAHESFGIVNTPEQTQENIATYNKLVEDKYASVILCYGMDMSSISTYTSAPVAVQYAILGGESQMMLCASIAVEEGYPMECIAVMPYPDGTMEVLMWQQTSAPSGPLRVWMNEFVFETPLTDEQKAENAATYQELVTNLGKNVVLVYDGEGVRGMIPTSSVSIDSETSTVALFAISFDQDNKAVEDVFILNNDGSLID